MSERVESGNVSMTELLELAVAGALDDVRVALPGMVIAYDASKQCVDVQPMVPDRVEDEDGEMVAKKIAPMLDVPVMFQGGSSYHQTFPVKAGDTCLLVFCSSSIARWKATGNDDDPGDSRHHHLSDAVAYIGVRDFRHPILGAPDNAWVTTVPFGGQIRLGSASATQSAVLGTTYRAAEDAMLGILAAFATAMAAYAVAIKPTVEPGPPPGVVTPALTGAAAALTAAILSFQAASASYLSLKVKVE